MSSIPTDGEEPITLNIPVHVAWPAITNVRIHTADVRLFEGARVVHDVVATHADGSARPYPEISWSSSDETIATVDAFGNVRAIGTGAVTINAMSEGVTGMLTHTVEASPVSSLAMTMGQERIRTGDVQSFVAIARDASGAIVENAPISWSYVYQPDDSIVAPSGPAQMLDGRMVADVPGVYTAVASTGGAFAEFSFQVTPRNAVRRLEVVGQGTEDRIFTTDFWIWQGVDGRDYAMTGSKFGDGVSMVWDVTDPSNPILTDSIQLDARRINDVKIHPNSRLGIVTREGASSRRNGMVLLDLAMPAHPTVLGEYTETLTGGVHNVWIDGDNELVYAVHNGTRAIHIIDISNPEAPNEVGRWQIDNQQRSLHDVIIQEGYAYASYWDDGVVILDVGAGSHGGTPRAPVLVSQFKYPVGNTHVAWRHGQYLFVGDEIFPAVWDADQPIEARGYIHVLDMSDIENPVEVAKYEVPEAGAHNVWTEGDRLYVGYYQAGLRVLDISGELRGDLYKQGREIAVIKTTDENTTTPNWGMTWGAQIFKGRIYSSDINSGLWITELKERSRIVS